MATVDFLTRLSSDFQDHLLELDQLIETCLDVAGDNCPSWLFTVMRVQKRVDAAAQEFVKAVNLQAMPLLRDMGRVNQPNVVKTSDT